MPPNATLLTPLKFVPVTVTIVPAGPLAGVKAVMVGGGGMTVKLVGLLAMPPGVVTEIEPVGVPVFTLAVMLVGFTRVKVDAAVPLNFTADALLKLVPVMVTTVK